MGTVIAIALIVFVVLPLAAIFALQIFGMVMSILGKCTTRFKAWYSPQPPWT